MDFLDNAHGILGTWNGTFEYIGGTLVTSDGGTTWNTYSLAEKNTDIFRVQQLSSTTSILATFVGPNSELGQLMKSSDNGISWEEVSIPMNDNNEDQRLISVDFVDGSSGVICSSNSGTAEVYGTSDDGQTWTLEALNLPTFISDVQLTENSGYIGGIVGTLYKRDLTNAIVYFPISIETRIYPTIAKSQDIISWTSAENFTKIVIMNESGCLISKYELDTNLISLPKLTSGVYFIHLSNDLYF